MSKILLQPNSSKNILWSNEWINKCRMNLWIDKKYELTHSAGGFIWPFQPLSPPWFFHMFITFAILTALPKQPSSCVCHLLQVWHYLGSREESPALHHIHHLEMLLCMCILLLQPWKYQNPNTNTCKYIYTYICKQTITKRHQHHGW